MYWPYFTYHSFDYVRRNAMLYTYQSDFPNECPTRAEVLATPRNERWATWDDPGCSVCKLTVCDDEVM